MPRLLYHEGRECCRCHRGVLLPYPEYRPSDLRRWESEAVVCRDCREVWERAA